MTNPGTNPELRPEPDSGKSKEFSPGTEAKTDVTGEKAAVDELTPEEQMAQV